MRATTPALGSHRPVLCAEMVAALAVRRAGIYVDGTFGAGGYSGAILDAGAGWVVGIDRDPAAVARGHALAAARPGFTMLEGRFGEMAALLATRGIERVEGVVLDLGMSSDQLDDPARGFSFALDGPLDMRMGRSGVTAAELIASADPVSLETIIARCGEEPAARRIARAIVAQRRRAPIETTRQLAEVVRHVIGPRPGRVDPATRTFQALRIHLNDELGELERGLVAAERLLRPGGRLVVVAFHSLEDRIVKHFLAARSDRRARPSRHQPEPAGGGPSPGFRPLGRGAVRPSPGEVATNPRARSARLRAAERLTDEGDAP